MKRPNGSSGEFKEIGWRTKMASPNNQKLNGSKPVTLQDATRKAQASRSGIYQIFSILKNKGCRLFDLGGTLAALFTIVDMCFVWYNAFFCGVATSSIYGSTFVGDFIIVLQIELMVIAPFAILWILAKFRGWI